MLEQLEGGYPDLHGQYGWTLGVHKAPAFYQHSWLVVTNGATYGAWSREHARQIMRDCRGR